MVVLIHEAETFLIAVVELNEYEEEVIWTQSLKPNLVSGMFIWSGINYRADEKTMVALRLLELVIVRFEMGKIYRQRIFNLVVDFQSGRCSLV